MTPVAVTAVSQVAIAVWALDALDRAPLGAPGAALGVALATLGNSGSLWLLRRFGGELRAVYVAGRAYLVLGFASLLAGPPLVALLALAALAAPFGSGAQALAAALFRVGGGFALALSFGCVLWGYLVGQRRIAVERVDLPVPGLPPALAGLSIAHVSDLHVGFQLRGARLRRFVERVNGLEADLIAMSGDLFDFDPAYIDEGCRDLAKLSAPAGVFAVLGNHDHYTGADAVEDGLRSLTPITVLRDQLARVELRGEALVLLGIDDPGRRWTERDSESPALQDLAEESPPDAFRILLVHRPSYFRQAARLGLPLVLAGHTHGGQVTLPGPARHWNMARLIAHWTRGAFREGDSVLYVNRGLGVAGPPVRLNCPREIALLRLVPAID